MTFKEFKKLMSKCPKFSREGLETLYDYLNSLEENIEFNPKDLCEDWNEFQSPEEYNDFYGTGYSRWSDIVEFEDDWQEHIKVYERNYVKSYLVRY